MQWKVEESYEDCVAHQAQWERIQGLSYAEAQAEGVRKCAPCYDEHKMIKAQFKVTDPVIVYGAGGHIEGTPKELKAKEDREAPGLVGGMKGKIAGASILMVAVIVAIGYLLLMGGKR